MGRDGIRSSGCKKKVLKSYPKKETFKEPFHGQTEEDDDSVDVVMKKLPFPVAMWVPPISSIGL